MPLPLMLCPWFMGGGLAGGKAEHRLMKITELVLYAEKMQKYTRNIETTAPTAAHEWTDEE